MAAEPKTAQKNRQTLNRRGRRVLRASFKRLQTAYGKAARGKPGDIHQARVSARRWAALCKILQSGLGRANARRMAKAARGPAKKLAGIRNLDIFRELACEFDLPRHRRVFERQRAALWRVSSRYVSPARLKKLYQDLTPGMQRFQPRLQESLDAANAHRKSWDRAMRAVLEKKEPGMKHWHKLRRAAKRRRYGLEAAQALGLLKSRARIKRLKKLQAVLGRAHDLELFREKLLHEFEPDAALQNRLRCEIKGCLRQAGKLLRNCR